MDDDFVRINLDFRKIEPTVKDIFNRLIDGTENPIEGYIILKLCVALNREYLWSNHISLKDEKTIDLKIDEFIALNRSVKTN